MNKHLSYSELHSISEQLDGMLIKHVNWLTSLHKVIVCKLSPCFLQRHHQDCDFAKWYCSVTHSALIETPDFIRLGVVHRNLHARANHLLEQYESNEVASEEEYDLFVDSEKVFFETLNNFIDNVLATKNQFDYLTNIPNRSLVTLILEKEYSRFMRNIDNSEYCIALADIDHFKHTNDTYGHETGDRVLKIVSKLFLNSIRTYDTVGRYGGEEFIFCFPQTSLNEATTILDGVRSQLEALSIDADTSNAVNVTCSFGVSKMQRNLSLGESIKQADEALYVGKNNGRNRIEVWIN